MLNFSNGLLERIDEFSEAEVLHQKHAAYYCQWLEEAETHLNGRDQIEWFGRMKVEIYNVQAALEWFLRQQETENAGRMVAILWRYWATQSLLSEGSQWIDRVLNHADQLSPLIHAKATQGAGRLALLHADYERASNLQQTSLSLYRSIAEPLGQAAVLQSLGEGESVQGNNRQAEMYLQEALALYREAKNEAGVGRCLNLMAKLVLKTGNFAKAEPLLYESLNLALAHGSSEAVALVLYDLGGVLRAQEKYQEAESYYRQGMTLFEELNFTVGVGTMLYKLGFTLQGLGNYPDAMDHLLRALRLLQPLDEPVAIAECLIGFASAFLHLGKRSLSIRTVSVAKAILKSSNAEGQIDYVDQAEYARIFDAFQMDAEEWQTALTQAQSIPLERMIQEIFQEVQLLGIGG